MHIFWTSKGFLGFSQDEGGLPAASLGATFANSNSQRQNFSMGTTDNPFDVA